MGFMDAVQSKKTENNFDISVLSPEEKSELDGNIDSIIERYRGNRQAVNRLVFESVAAMTSGEEYERQLSNRRGIKRFVGSITGSNKKLQDKINRSRSAAQYASQQTLQRLAEQNAMSFDLIAAVNNKLNASMIAVEKELVQVYDYLTRFFKQTRSDMIQLESRIEKLERNVNLLNWQNSIEYQVFDGIEYAELDDAAKIVCLARDFYEITKGDWTTSDLLLLKTAMGTIDLNPKESGSYFDFIRRLGADQRLKAKLLGNLQLIRQPDAGYLTMLGGVKKLELLGTKERYIVNAVLQQLNQPKEEEEISENLTKTYLEQEALVNVNCEAPYYDLLMELIYSLRQAEDEGLLGEEIEEETEESLEAKFKRASDLFRTYHPKEALPLLKELSDAGYGEANALLYWLYIDGYYENQRYCGDEATANKYARKGYEEGDAVSSVLYGLFGDKLPDEEIVQFLPEVQEMAENGDIYAEYALGIVDVNSKCGGLDYLSAVQHFMKSNETGFYRAVGSIFLRYYRGDKPFQKDWISCSMWASEVLKYGHPDRVFDVAYMYMHIEDYGCKEEDKKEDAYQSAIKLWEELTELGDSAAPVNLGWMYENGKGVQADPGKEFYYYSIAAERGNKFGQFNLANNYSKGSGTPANKEKAIEWYHKSAEQGYQKAIDALHRLGVSF